MKIYNLILLNFCFLHLFQLLLGMYPGEGSGSTQHSVEPNDFNELDDKIRPLLEKVGDLPPIGGSQQFNNAREQYENLFGELSDLLNESIQINELTINYLNARIETRVLVLFFLFKILLAYILI
ncbi:unnamed protein product [Meloidogyne enterolobii]|uniref:Uncharacterized protein n=2 Tax=Meloidogyne enterolobii TaxID=390850 RepID=A0ACB0YMP1_MELEN